MINYQVKNLNTYLVNVAVELTPAAEASRRSAAASTIPLHHRDEHHSPYAPRSHHRRAKVSLHTQHDHHHRARTTALATTCIVATATETR